MLPGGNPMVMPWKHAAAALLLTLPLVSAAAPAVAAPVCTAPAPSTTQPGYLVADPGCDVNGTPFLPLTDAAGAAISKTFTGVRDGAAFRVEVPRAWNGQLVVYAHGYRGTGAT